MILSRPKDASRTGILTLIWSLLVARSLGVLTSSQCTFPDGTSAVSSDYEVCNPDATQSACCFHGEACLANGLCYGSLGLIYRGACAGGWGNSTACPEQCSTSIGFMWTNFYYCPSHDPPWWCGRDTICDSNGSTDRNEFFSLPGFGMSPTGIVANSTLNSNFRGCNIYEQESTSTIMTTATVTAVANATATWRPEVEHNSTMPLAGGVAGIAVLGTLAIAAIVWALWERKLRIGSSKTASYDNHSVEYDSDKIILSPTTAATTVPGYQSNQYLGQTRIGEETKPFSELGPNRESKMYGPRASAYEMPAES